MKEEEGRGKGRDLMREGRKGRERRGKERNGGGTRMHERGMILK